MKKLIALLTLSLVVLMASGCTSLIGGSTGSTSDYGTLVMSLADAPVNDVESVFVTLKEVQVVTADDEKIILNDFADEGGEKEFDLLQLRFDEALLGNELIPAGSYTGIRLIVAEREDGTGNSYVTFKPETGLEQRDIVIPSATQSGIKIQYEFAVEEGGVTELTIDWDVNTMLKEAGNSGKIMMRPTVVIKVLDEVNTGELEGRVVVQDPTTEELVAITDYDVMIQIIDAAGVVVEDTVASVEEQVTEERTIPAGTFQFRGLEAGTYTIQVKVVDENEAEVLNTENTPLYVQSEELSVEIIAGEEVTLQSEIILEKVGEGVSTPEEQPAS